jgi:glycosyltransferase involved in cell wall biosynthesis
VPVDRSPRVVIDGFHMRLPAATGIGTYARTLADNLRGLGCSVGVLFGQRVGGNLASPLGLASQVFGGTREDRPAERRFYHLTRALDIYLRNRSRRTLTVPIGHADLATLDNPIPAIDHAYNSDRLFDRANERFAVRHAGTRVQLPGRADAVHWTYPLPLSVKGVPNIYTLHDLIPLRYPHLVVDRNGRAAALMDFVARRADLIVTVSESSKRDIVDHLKVPEERVAVTYQSQPPLPTVSAEDSASITRDIYGAEPGNFILFVGAIEPKKNLRRLIEAHVTSGTAMPLIIAGPLGWSYETDIRFMEMVTEAQRRAPGGGAAADRIRYLGFLPRRHLAALLQSAAVFAFPSICEGFGLPVLEAMAAGIPVITSNTTSMPEVVGDAARLVDPLDVSSIARGIRDLAGDADMRREYALNGLARARAFSPEAYRRRLAEAYRRVGVELPGTVRHPRAEAYPSASLAAAE